MCYSRFEIVYLFCFIFSRLVFLYISVLVRFIRPIAMNKLSTDDDYDADDDDDSAAAAVTASVLTIAMMLMIMTLLSVFVR